MDNEKRLLLAFILSFFILFFFQKNFKPSASQTQESVVTNSISQPVTQKPVLLQQAINTQEYKTDQYTITYTPTGGYITNIIYNKFNDNLHFTNILRTPEYDNILFSIKELNNSLIFISTDNDKKIEKRIVFNNDNTITCSIGSYEQTDLYLVAQQLDPNKANARYQEFFYKGEKWEHKNNSKLKTSFEVNKKTSSGLRGRYYAAILIDVDPLQVFKNKENLTLVQKTRNAEFTMYLGPQTKKDLELVGMQDIINFGLFDPIAGLLLAIIGFFFSIFKNWGISIILLSITVYITCFPLTAKSTKSMKKMQEIQPQLEVLKEKYKDNPQRFQKETMELYREYNVNPMSGCFPIFLQMPVFISLYQILYRLVDLKGANFLWISDLSKPDYLITFPINLPIIGNGLHLLPILMAALTFAQQKMTTPKAQMTEQQKNMIIIMPAILLVIFYSFPSGLVLYWMTNSILTTSYQYFLKRK